MIQNLTIGQKKAAVKKPRLTKNKKAVNSPLLRSAHGLISKARYWADRLKWI
jgi:hypothetical protein